MSGINGVSNFAMQMTSDFQEKDIVYGGDKKLATLLRETKELFPLAKGISVLSECPVGLIGDDINSVAKTMSKELDLPIIPCNCEGFRAHRRLQHRRRRLVGETAFGGVWVQRQGHLDRRRPDGTNCSYTSGEVERHPLLPLHELHGPGHGREIQDPLA
jgi:hypothetical protein